jgi:hypothetical protein
MWGLELVGAALVGFRVGQRCWSSRSGRRRRSRSEVAQVKVRG